MKGTGNQQDYGMRIYDPRVAKFLSVDPLTKDYPELTPYQFAGNTPIPAIDLDGAEPLFINSPEFRAEYAMSKIRHPNASELFLLIESVPNAVFRLPFMEESVKIVAAPLNVIEYTNRNSNQKDPKIREENNKMAKAAAADVVMGWGTTKLFGVTLKTFGQFGVSAAKTLSKSERINIFFNDLSKAKSVGNQQDAIKLINKTLDKVEDAYSGVKKAEGIPGADDGRMYGILDDKFVTTLDDGTKIAYTKGNRIVLEKDGGIKIQSKDGNKTYLTKPGAQNK